MFAELLVEEERRRLLDLLAYLAAADGEPNDREIMFLNDARERLDLRDHDAVASIRSRSLEDICKNVGSEKARRILLVELLNLAHADSTYSDAERAGMRRIAALLGVDDEALTSLERWVEDGFAWRGRGEVLLGIAG